MAARRARAIARECTRLLVKHGKRRKAVARARWKARRERERLEAAAWGLSVEELRDQRGTRRRQLPAGRPAGRR